MLRGFQLKAVLVVLASAAAIYLGVLNLLDRSAWGEVSDGIVWTEASSGNVVAHRIGDPAGGGPRAGIETGDRLVELGGIEIRSLDDYVEVMEVLAGTIPHGMPATYLIQKTPGLVAEFDLARGKQIVQELANRLRIESRRYEVLGNSSDEQIAALEEQADRLRAIVRFNEDRVASLDVTAGVAGVLAELPMEAGQWVRAGDTLGRVVEPGAYVGAAVDEFRDAHLYPTDTEFLHTVRYLGIGPDGTIVPSRRMKEVRYMRKWVAYRKVVYARTYQLEAFEKELGHLPQYIHLGDRGLDNKFGWSVQGFIEDPRGELRAATFEENLFCMGCHTSVGSTIDKTFAFPRKVDGAAGWGYIDLHGMPDAPNVGETEGEIATYLARVGGGSEFRHNPEMTARWFRPDGTLDRARVARARDVYELIAPSVERALALNKAYRVIVGEQDYLYGRDPTTHAPANVYREIDNARAPTLPASLAYPWDIRLAWSQRDRKREAPAAAAGVLP